ETEGMSAWDHLRVLIDHTDPRIVQACIVNTEPIPREMVSKYAGQKAEPVGLDLEVIRAKGYEVIEGEILKVDGQVRHNPEKLSRLIFDYYFKMVKAAEKVAAS
ncbi:MAG: 2-phospho-L-lactate transferase CofD family protein, partial [Candidatus Omnitrophota bacterium]